MVRSNSQKYRIQADGTCLPRSDEQKKYDWMNNYKYCKSQDFSPTTSKNTRSNTFKKRIASDPKGAALRAKKNTNTKTVRIKTPTPSSGGKRSKKYKRRKQKRYTKKYLKRCVF
tara:strand:- start:108 stop:449 length:342 start_codon:yes stop_codon:yes gene_type:complete